MRAVWRRFYSFQSTKFKPRPNYKLKCGLEIHTQLNTKKKLFSLSNNDAFLSIDAPNSNASFFDVALPGSQPVVNNEAVLHALKLSLAMKCIINLRSQFDRKHYFYGDQPAGYQITQHYSPISSNGLIKLYKDTDGIDQDVKDVTITQLQLEQDTGKCTYDTNGKTTQIDLNRSNIPLVEMVTEPDFTDIKQVRAFIKKYQNLVRHLNVSTGDLESGAMRVDVNLSINDYARVELKNLPNTSSIMAAIIYEYERQVGIIEAGDGEKLLREVQTRGWNGASTVKLRSKETTIDYRFLPDPELPYITLSESLVKTVSSRLPVLPDEMLKRLMTSPYNLTMKDAKILVIRSNSQNELYTNIEVQRYYLEVFEFYRKEKGGKINDKLPVNWIIHRLLGDINKLNVTLKKVKQSLPPKKFVDLLLLLHDKKITDASAKLLLFHAVNSIKNSDSDQAIDFPKMMKEFDLENIEKVDIKELEELCRMILNEMNNDTLLKEIVSGKKKGSMKFLVGQGMRASQGKIKAQNFEQMFKKFLDIKW